MSRASGFTGPANKIILKVMFLARGVAIMDAFFILLYPFLVISTPNMECFKGSEILQVSQESEVIGWHYLITQQHVDI